MDNDVREYIENRKISRMPDQDIVSELVSNGWKQVDAAHMVANYMKGSAVRKSRIAWIILIGIIIVVLAGIVVYVLNYGTPSFIII